MKQNILIVEDNEKIRKMLVSMLHQIDEDLTILETDNIDVAYRYALQYTIHLFLLDIILDSTKRGDVSGITLAGNIRQVTRYRTTPIIFITSLEDPKLYAYSEIHCYQYIEKPFDEEKTLIKIREALGLEVDAEKHRSICFRKDGLLFPAKVNEIVYIIVEKRNTSIYLKRDYIKVSHLTVKKILLMLDSEDFLQCNRNVIVNRNYIEYVDTINGFVKMKSINELMQIGISYKKKFVSELDDD